METSATFASPTSIAQEPAPTTPRIVGLAAVTMVVGDVVTTVVTMVEVAVAAATTARSPTTGTTGPTSMLPLENPRVCAVYKAQR
jgi:hypothetical protein